MKKIYISLFIVGILSISLVAAATGWPILDIFKGKQAKAAPSDGLMIVPHVVADQASCNAQIAQNRQLLLLIIDHLGIQNVDHITGEPVRRVARNTRARDAQTMRTTARQRTIERAPTTPIRRSRGAFERAPSTPIQIRDPDVPEMAPGSDASIEECLEGPPPYLFDGDIGIDNNYENCAEWVENQINPDKPSTHGSVCDEEGDTKNVQVTMVCDDGGMMESDVLTCSCTDGKWNCPDISCGSGPCC